MWVAEDKSNDPGDVYECDLSTGTMKPLVSHKKLPSSFPLIDFSCAPKGDYIDVKARDYGPINNPGILLIGTWRWDRKTNKVRKIEKADSDSVSKGNCTITTTDTYVTIINTKNGKKRSIKRDEDELYNWGWSEKDKGFLVVESAYKKTSKFWLQPLWGNRTLLFKWRKEIRDFELSPDGQQVAIYDGKGIFLVNRDGSHPRRLKVPVPVSSRGIECTDVSFWFNSKMDKVAVLTDFGDGEPLSRSVSKLWIVDLKTYRNKLVDSWDVYTSDVHEECSVVAWLSDNKSIIIYGNVSYGDDMPLDTKNDWDKYYYMDASKAKPRKIKIFDSGKGCVGSKWRPN